VVVGPGSKHLLYALLSALGSPGAKVAIATPHYPAYELAATRLGMRPVRVPTSMETSWRLDPSAIGEAKILLLCNPSNPTSTVLPPADVRRILEQARQRGTVAILDEAYRGLAFEEVPLYSDAIRVRSFSKEFNMEGYAVAPQDVVAKVVSVIQATTTCVPDFVQEAGAACLDREESLLTEHRRIWRERSRAAQEALRQAGFRFSEPGAAMYLFATHPRLTDSGAFALKLLERGIAVAPGTGFGDFPSFIRLCVNQEATVLRQAVAEMAALLQG
jgi:aspartate aminotransferase